MVATQELRFARCSRRAVTDSDEEMVTFSAEDYKFGSPFFEIDVSDKFCYQTDEAM